MTQVLDPGGNPLEFPDDMSMDAIKSVMRQKFGGPSQSIPAAQRFTEGNMPTPLGDLKEAFGSLPGAAGQFAAHAAAGLPSIPGNIEQLVRSVLPVSQTPVNPFTSQVLSNKMTGGDPVNPAESSAAFAGDVLSPAAYGKLASNVIGPLMKTYAGLRTGTGPAPIQEAFDAGAEGGMRGTTFAQNMRGGAPLSNAVDAAKDALGTLYKERSDAYRQAIDSGLLSDPKVLDFKPIDTAIRASAKVAQFKGESLSASADKTWNKIENVIDDWRLKAPEDFHTVEGLDALKKKIYNLADDENLQPRSAGANMVRNVTSAIRRQIMDQAPGYAKVMGDYADASDELSNIERSLSLGDKATVDTSLGKLQSIMRNDVNSRFGQRAVMGERLNQANPTLMPSLAGQALNSPYPRGLNKLLASGEAASLPVAALTHPEAIPAIVADMGASSPRLVGEIAHGLGKLSRPFQQAPFGFGGSANVGGLTSINPAQIGAMSPAVLARILGIGEPVAQPQ